MNFIQSIDDPISRSILAAECQARREVLNELAKTTCYRCKEGSVPHYFSGKEWEHAGGWKCLAASIHELISEVPYVSASPIYKFTYESWGPNLEIPDIFCPISSKNEHKIGNILRYRVYASTWEEACSIYHLREGWEPYLPQGEAELCPRECGANYYPKGSGDCRNCGHIE